MAGAANPYAAGAKVYNGGTSAATRGTVNPMGYIDRSLNQQASTKRAGLAKAAINRVKSTVKPKPKQPSAAFMSVANRLKASATGKVTAKPAPRLPYDYDLEAQRIAQTAAYNDLVAGLNAQKSQVQQDYFSRSRELDTGVIDNRRAALNNNVARGMGYSSSYLNDMTMVNDQYNKARNQNIADTRMAANAINTQRMNADRSLQDVMAMLARENANRQAIKRADPNFGGAALNSGYKAPKPTAAPKAEKLMGIPGNSKPKPKSKSSNKKAAARRIASKKKGRGK